MCLWGWLSSYRFMSWWKLRWLLIQCFIFLRTKLHYLRLTLFSIVIWRRFNFSTFSLWVTMFSGKKKKSGMVFWILRVAFVCLCVCIYIQFLHTGKCLALVAYVSDLSNTIMYLFSSESSCYNLSLHYNCSSSLAPSSIYFFILIIPWSHCLVYFSGREFIILFLTNFDRTSFF